MWYILILFFVGVFFWNLCVKEYEDEWDISVNEYEDETEVEMVKDICYPIIGISVSAILGLIF